MQPQNYAYAAIVQAGLLNHAATIKASRNARKANV